MEETLSYVLVKWYRVWDNMFMCGFLIYVFQILDFLKLTSLTVSLHLHYVTVYRLSVCVPVVGAGA